MKPEWKQTDNFAYCTIDSKTLLTMFNNGRQELQVWEEGFPYVKELSLPAYQFSLDVANTLWLMYQITEQAPSM